MVIDCEKIANESKERAKDYISKQEKKIKLAIINIGDNPSANSYLKGKIKDCEYVGIIPVHFDYSYGTSKDVIVNAIQTLNEDYEFYGIIVQCPIPEYIGDDIVDYILPRKDVDNLSGKSEYIPCTPKGIMNILSDEEVTIEGRTCVCVGKGKLVGKPMIEFLSNAGGNVIVCDSKTEDLKSETLKADILVVATGNKGLIKRDMIRECSVVIDAGVNFEDGKMYGDVDKECYDLPIRITPVPKGVGLTTRAALLENIVESYRKFWRI